MPTDDPAALRALAAQMRAAVGHAGACSPYVLNAFLEDAAAVVEAHTRLREAAQAFVDTWSSDQVSPQDKGKLFRRLAAVLAGEPEAR